MNLKQIKRKYNLAGVVTIAYDGSGDSGCINDIGIVPERDLGEAEKELESFVYDMLCEKHGGWEINEGSQGTIEIDFTTNTMKINHGWRETIVNESTDTEKF